MQYALQVAKMGQGETWPNPAVGCVIVSNFDSKKKKPAIIGTGHTSKGGLPHAEIVAMNSANKNLDGATLYVTLEPCCIFVRVRHVRNKLIKITLKRKNKICKREYKVKRGFRKFSMVGN